MWQASFTLTLGFVLTVLIGGAYASYLQQRSWRHQNQSRLDEEERKQASQLCTALSELLDKRRYRSQRLLQAIRERAQDEASDDELQDRRSEYEKVLADWNDQLTTRLVSTRVYFGHDVHDYLEATIDRRLQDVDDRIEKLYRQVMAAPDTVGTIATADVDMAEEPLDALRKSAYELSFKMMLHIRRGETGRTAPRPLRPQQEEQPFASTQPGPIPLARGEMQTELTSSTTPVSTRNFRQQPATTRAFWRRGPSIAISAIGPLWVICMSMPMWDWSWGSASGWQLLTEPGTRSEELWGWLPALAMLAIAALAAATLTERWSRYHALVQRSAIAVGAVSVATLVALGVQATDSFQSYCSGVASCLGEEGLGIGYYLSIAAAALTAASGLWAVIQRRRTDQPPSQPSVAGHSTPQEHLSKR